MEAGPEENSPGPAAPPRRDCPHFLQTLSCKTYAAYECNTRYDPLVTDFECVPVSMRLERWVRLPQNSYRSAPKA